MASRQDTEQDRASRLLTLLWEHRDGFAYGWAQAVCRDFPESHYAKLPREELIARAQAATVAAVEIMKSNRAFAWPSSGLFSPAYLLNSGFDVGEVVRVAMLTQSLLPQAIKGLYPVDSPEVAELQAEAESRVRRFLGDFLTAVVTEAQARVEEERERTAMVLEAAKAASSSLDLNEVVRRMAQVLTLATGADHCWFYRLHKGDKAGGTWLETGSLESHACPAGEVMCGLLSQPPLSEREPLACQPVTERANATAAYAMGLGLNSALIMPLVVEGRVLGAAVAGCFTRDCHFSRSQIELAQGIANVAAPAIENASVYRKAERIGVMEERLRLARELHDSLAQQLSFLILKTSTTAQAAARREVEQVQSGLEEIGRVVDEACVDLREAIFCLRASVPSGPQFWSALGEYMDEYRAHYGVDARLSAPEGRRVFLSPHVATQLSRIILEALTNVRKHSQAERVSVEVSYEDGQTVVAIEDDGRGFDVAQAMESGGSRIGLGIMRERAECCGGTLQFDSVRGRGTRIVVRVPSSQEG